MRTKRQAGAWLTVLELLGEVQKLAEMEDSVQRYERTIWSARRGIWFAKKALARANSNEEIERALKHRRIWEEILLRTKAGEKPGRDVIAGSGPNAKRELFYMAQMNVLGVIRQKIEALPENFSKEDVLRLLDECEPKEPIEPIAGIKPMTLIQMLAEIDANPDDPRVIRLFELSVKTREHTLTEEERLERFKILEALVLEARAKGKTI
jgi:hypothetical protein